MFRRYCPLCEKWFDEDEKDFVLPLLGFDHKFAHAGDEKSYTCGQIKKVPGKQVGYCVLDTLFTDKKETTDPFEGFPRQSDGTVWLSELTKEEISEIIHRDAIEAKKWK